MEVRLWRYLTKICKMRATRSFISCCFYYSISRYHFSQIFRTSFNFICKKDFRLEFSIERIHSTPLPPPHPLTPLPPLFNDQNLLSVTKVFCRCSLTLYTYVLAQALQNGTKFIQKLTIGFKNHMRNMRNFRQAVESPKSWNLMGFCPKNTFLQLKPIQRIYLTLLSTTCVKIHQITDVIFETTSHFSQHNPSVSFLLKHNILSRKEPIKVQFSDFQLLRLKLTKFLMSFFK